MSALDLYPVAPLSRKVWLGALLWVSLFPALTAAADLGIVRVVAQPPGQSVAQFTATHIGNGVLLSCGHCCRYAGGPQASVEVLVLHSETRQPYRSIPGRVLCYDPKADVGLLRLDNPEELKTTYQLAPPQYQARVGLPVLLYGWNTAGNQLHSIRSVVTNVDMFVGPPNLVTRDHPHPGDSGSPLVSLSDGFIIGVTTAADLYDRFGVHCGTPPIHQLLAGCGVKTEVIQRTSGVQE